MSHSRASTGDLDDFALVGPELATAACVAALERLRKLMTAPPAATDAGDTNRLASFAQRISGVLDLAAEAIAEEDEAAAAIEHGRALALMNALRLAAASDGEPAPAPAQKSGATG